MKVAFFPGVGAVNNPYLKLIADALTELGQSVGPYRVADPLQSPDVLHLHWLEGLYMTRFVRRSGLLSEAAFDNLVATADRVRRRGGKLVWTAHNVRPHEPPPAIHRRAWERGSARIFDRLDTVICMSEYGAEVVRQAYPGLAAKFVVIPHPHYGGVYRAARSRQDVRAELGLRAEDRLIAAIGMVRPYKKLPDLIERFLDARRSNERLVIAGKCHDPALAASIDAARGGDRSVIIIDKMLSDTELADLYSAADAAISNGDGLLNSGTVLTALSLNRPVIAPRSGSQPEIQQRVGDAWCVLFDAPLTTAALRRALDQSETAVGTPDLSHFDPQHVGRLHLAAYEGRSES
jgi:glycosyltransferase involved in cell wall biosynthesis